MKMTVFSWKGQGQEGKIRIIRRMQSTCRKNLRRGIGIAYYKLLMKMLMRKIILKKTMKEIIFIGIK